MNMMQLAQALIEKIARDYKDDISLVHLHGSYAYGAEHDQSDLDIYFVPKTQRGYELGYTFIVDGIGCDLWALSWERLERIAAHEERTATIITEGKVLWYSSDEDLKRFERLQALARDTSDRSAWLARANKILEGIYKDAFFMQNSDDISQVRSDAIGLVYTISFALAQLNGNPIRRGRKLLKEEILAMPLVPDDFAPLYDALFYEAAIDEIKKAAVKLVQNTEKLVSGELSKTSIKRGFADVFRGWYEEMIQSYNKIYHAHAIGDVYTPLFAAVEYSYELGEMLKQVGIEPNLPDMVAAYDSGDLSKIEKAAHAHQQAFEALLKENGIAPLRFSTMEEAVEYLNGR
ncbi:MAG: nucleotidyltransferase domain-containing protein [Oscillospiraceae bacterium]|jgi:hypothetical protein|nr:nucleotidyltransferase domain-containing protein [Oscillospiraceae bacterium]